MSDAMLPQPKPGIMDIDIYVPGKSRAPAGVKLHKLSSNENPLGPSPTARQAIIDSASHPELYPDGSASALKGAIARAHAINP